MNFIKKYNFENKIAEFQVIYTLNSFVTFFRYLKQNKISDVKNQTPNRFNKKNTENMIKLSYSQNIGWFLHLKSTSACSFNNFSISEPIILKRDRLKIRFPVKELIYLIMKLIIRTQKKKKMLRWLISTGYCNVICNIASIVTWGYNVFAGRQSDV